jgi:hypothetical protein
MSRWLLNPMLHDPSKWMGDLAAKLRTKPLRNLVIAGSHDSGTSLIDSRSDLSPDAPAFPVLTALPRPLIGPVLSAFSKAQGMTVLQQLQAGVRYLDLRVCRRDHSGELYVIHSMYSHKLSVVLDEICSFASGAAHEVIIVHIQHFYNMNLGAHQSLAAALKLRFQGRLIPRSATVHISLGDVWKSRWQIVLVYGDDSNSTGSGAATVSGSEPLFWTQSEIHSKWHNTPLIQTLKRGLDGELQSPPGDKLFVLQAVLSPDVSTILSYITTGARSSLEKMARSLAPLVPTWVRRDFIASHLNVLIIDWVGQSDFVDACIEANGL